MTGALDDLYLTWLYSQVGDVKVRNKSRTYWDIFRQMYEKDFVWIVPNDDNRVEDGRDLRHEWDHVNDIHVDPRWMSLRCSFLEMLIALSRRLAFEAEGEPATWFWHLMENLGLHECTDRSKYDQQQVEDRLDDVIWRTYEPDGRGGLFPMRYSEQDQRQVEIWYQLNEYLLDG